MTKERPKTPLLPYADALPIITGSWAPGHDLDSRQRSGSSTTAPRTRRSASASRSKTLTPWKSAPVTSALLRFAPERVAPASDAPRRDASERLAAEHLPASPSLAIGQEGGTDVISSLLRSCLPVSPDPLSSLVAAYDPVPARACLRSRWCSLSRYAPEDQGQGCTTPQAPTVHPVWLQPPPGAHSAST